MKRMKKLLSIYLPLCIMLAMGSCSEKEQVSEKESTFVLSETMVKTTYSQVVNKEKIRNELRFYGKITADKNKLIEVYPVVGGNVLKVYAELGDYVKKGQLLATIRSTEV